MKKNIALLTIMALMIAFTGCKKKNYNVIFESNGGTDVVSQKVTNGQKAVKPSPNPTKEDYIFGGWYKDNNIFNDEWDFATDVVNRDITLYAKWNVIPPNSFTVTFNSMGGSAVDTQIVTDGNKVPKPANPTQNNLIFEGWFKETALTNEWDFATDVVTANITLYAKWKNTFVVTFNSNGGNAVDPQTVPQGNKVPKPADPTRTGYTFVGWFIGDNEWNFETAIIAAITLVAKWDIISYTVTFNSDGGGDIPSQTIEYNNKVIEPATPTKPDRLFGGWYNGATEWNFATDVVTAHITLTAKWSETYTVSFNSDGGSPVPNQIIAKEASMNAPTPPTKTNHIFAGWFTVTDNKFETKISFPYTPTSNTTLYAKWWIMGTGAWNEIKTAAELDAVRAYLSGQYRLMNDINLSAYSNWEPIGTASANFSGKFDGAGFKIINLSISSSPQYAGLFGLVNGSGNTIMNLGVETSGITGREFVGGIAGRVNNGTITGCYSKGTITATNSLGNAHAGGIVGFVNNGTITECYSTGNITANNNVNSFSLVDANSGGIAGYVNNGTITRCYSTGNITANNTNTSLGISNSGGIAGNTGGSITNCYSTGSIAATARNETNSGGIAGKINNNNFSEGISNSYSTGVIYSTTTYTATANSGGIVGRISNGTVFNCTAINPEINSISFTTGIGRIAGVREGSGTPSNNFALDNMVAQGGAIFNTNTVFHGIDKTDAELKMRTTYENDLGWDFTGTWKMPAVGDYPILNWQ